MKLLVIFISLLFILPQQTDKYYVVKVSGEILNTATGKHLNQGDEVFPDDLVEFANKGSYALVVGEKSERYKLAPPEMVLESDGAFKDIVKNTLTKSGRIRSKTRSIITNADIKDLKEFLGEDEFTVIGNSLNVQLSKQAFLDKSVLAKYDKDGKIIDKELIDENFKLNLSRQNLGVKSSGEVKLYHVEFFEKEDAAGIRKITRLDFNFVDEAAITDELETIIGVYKKKNFDKIQMKNFLMEYFIDFYGNTHMYTLSEFVDKIIAVRMK
jgi:hypothetical protein